MIFKNDTRHDRRNVTNCSPSAPTNWGFDSTSFSRMESKIANQLCFVFTILLFRVSRRATRLENKMSQEQD